MTDRGLSQRSLHPRAPVALLVLATACWLAFAAPSRSEDDLGGNYIVLDGPQAGVSVRADGDGSVDSGALEAFSAQGHIRRPTQACKQLHFKGRIEDSDAGVRACWRVVLRPRASELLRELSDALAGEERARHVNNPKALQSLNFAQHDLARAFDSLDEAARAGDITEAKRDQLKDDLLDVKRIDDAAEELVKKDKRVEARRKLERAQELKHHVVDSLPVSALLAKPPQLKPIEAEFQSQNRQTVYTERATDPEGLDLKYHWTLVEHNDPTCINFEPNEPKKNQAIWHHGDDQGCNHGLEGPRGHVGTITVIVSDRNFRCAAFYDGSQGTDGNPIGTGPDPAPCQPIER